MYKKILVGIDDDKPSQRAVDSAVTLAEQLGSEILLLHVIDLARVFVPELGVSDRALLAHLHSIGGQLLERELDRVPNRIKSSPKQVEGEPAEMIIATAREWGADLIVIGSDSRGRLSHFILGSTADSVIRKASCPVMTVRAEGTGSPNPPPQTVTTA